MKKQGMAIPLVLGFIVVSALLGSSLLFLSRTRNTNTHKNIGRLQLIHVAQMGLHEALVFIKPLRFSEFKTQKGDEWKFKTQIKNFGRASSWCEVCVKIGGYNRLEIESIGHWKEKNSSEQKKSFSCDARYSEKVTTGASSRFSSNTKIEGEWKLENFIEKALD